MAPKAEKEKSLKADEAEELVLNYLNAQNRPFGATDLSANLKNRVTKMQAAKTLAALQEKGEITGKTYGKIIVYCALQKDTDTLSPEELQLVEGDIATLKDEERDLKEELKALAAENAALLSTPTTAEIPSKLQAAFERSKILSSHLASLRPPSSQVSSVDSPSCATSTPTPAFPATTQDGLTALNLSFKTVRATLVARRKIAKEVEGMLLEMFDKKKGDEAACWELVGGEGELKDVDATVWAQVVELG